MLSKLYKIFGKRFPLKSELEVTWNYEQNFSQNTMLILVFFRVKPSQCAEKALNATDQSASKSERIEIENVQRVVVRIVDDKKAVALFGIILSPIAN